MKDLEIILWNEFAKLGLFVGRSAQAAFVGVPEEEFSEWDYGLFDVNSFAVSNMIKNAWDFAHGDYPYPHMNFCEELVELSCIQAAYFPEGKRFEPGHAFSVNEESLLGFPLDYISGALEKLLNKTFARFSLAESTTVTDSQIALLASVDIRTVKNAISAKGSDKLVAERATDETGQVVYIIQFKDAIAWLSKRRGFVPIYGSGPDEMFIDYYIKNAESPAGLSAVIFGHDQMNDEKDQLKKTPHYSVLAKWMDREFDANMEVSHWVSEKIGADPALLFGKIAEMTVRSSQKK